VGGNFAGICLSEKHEAGEPIHFNRPNGQVTCNEEKEATGKKKRTGSASSSETPKGKPLTSWRGGV